MKFKSDGKCQVTAGKRVIARAYVGDERYEVRILQGMPRMETLAKIRQDCPEFILANEIPDNYYPYLFAAK